MIAPRSRTSKKKNLSRRRYFRLSEGLTRQHFYQYDFFQNDSSFSLLLFQNNACKFVFVLQIDRVLLSMFCTWFVTLWKTSSPRNPPTSRKLLPFNPPSPSEFPMVFRGGGGGVWIFSGTTHFRFLSIPVHLSLIEKLHLPAMFLLATCLTGLFILF